MNFLPATLEAQAAHLRGETPIFTREFRLRCKDGAYKWILARGLVVERDAAGRPLRMIGTVRDVHEHYLIEEREKRQQQELERAGRLIHVGEMASALAHELNQPLTAINNYCSGMVTRIKDKKITDEDLLGALEKTSRQAQRAGQFDEQHRQVAPDAE